MGVTLTGSFTLDTAGINWPEIELRGLSIDSAGHVSLQGGWIDLPSQCADRLLRLPCGAAASRLRDRHAQDAGSASPATSTWWRACRWAARSAGFRSTSIPARCPSAASRSTSRSPTCSSFSGQIEHANLTKPGDAAAAGLPSSFPVPADVFAGGVDVTDRGRRWPRDRRPVPRGAGHRGPRASSSSLDAELPVGIPLFTDVALYGLSGMFATNLHPNIGSDTWWDWYKYPTAADGTPDVNGSARPPGRQRLAGLHRHRHLQMGSTPSMAPLRSVRGRCIGTQDDGFTASASIAFILILPGPVIMLIGKANIFSPRISGPAEEANFEAMATYDGNAGTFDLVIEAQYSIPVILDVQATGELYVDPSVPVWYLAIGKPPHEQRVIARVLDLFESDFYFVVSDTGLVAGFWVGYKNSWSFGPLSASIDAYMAAMGAIQWSPPQLGAGVELHGEVQLSAFGIGLGITADALLEATAPSPWWVYGSSDARVRPPLAAAERRGHGVAVVGRQRPTPAGTAGSVHR